MNTKNNLRFQETEQKIKTAYSTLVYKKSIDKITVSDICTQANIHRTTFYGHYEDINSLSYAIGIEQFKKFYDNFFMDGSFNYQESILTQLTFFYSHKEIIRRNLNTFLNQSTMDFFLEYKQQSSVLDWYLKTFHCASLAEAKYFHLFISTGTTTIISNWINTGFKESPEEITEILLKLLSMVTQTNL